MTGADGIAVPWGGAGRAGVQAAGLAVLMRAHARWYDVSGQGSVLIIVTARCPGPADPRHADRFARG